MVGRSLPAHVKATFVLYGEGSIGVGGARAAIERMYDGEEYMLMIDAGSVCFGGIAHVAIGTPNPSSKRNRAGFHRAKGRSPTGERVLGDVPARLAQAGAIQGENSHNPRHQPGGAVPRLRARESTGQRPV